MQSVSQSVKKNLPNIQKKGARGRGVKGVLNNPQKKCRIGQEGHPYQTTGQPWILYDASMGFPGRKSIVRVAYKSFFSGPDQITKEDIQNRCGSRIKEAF